MADLLTLTRLLDELENQLPDLIQDNPDPGDFWMAFAGQADVIEDQAGEFTSVVRKRLNTMLAQHGRYIAVVDQ